MSTTKTAEQKVTHERLIFASDDALREAEILVRNRTPLKNWPRKLRQAMTMALCQSCDDTRYAPNRISARRANDLNQFLLRRGIITNEDLPGLYSASPDLLKENPSLPSDVLYNMDRLLSDLISAVLKSYVGQKNEG
ncbi:hypothetical protein JKG47_14105 [Acidithiobacillus sp. MC6.1]|nr:hypothetical protein [Acidithiobacillus sp. MC6.1]